LHPQPSLFKGPIPDTKWKYDPSKVQINLEEAQKLYRMSIPKEEALICDIFKNDALFE
jgi:hypothetical protein